MTTRSWLRNLFASRTPRTIRKAPARRHLQVEALEERVVMNSYTAATTADLIADIGLANAAGGANTITLSAAPSSHYTLTAVNNSTDGATGLPVIAANDNLTIVGNGDTIERSVAAGTPAFRLFDVAAGATLTLNSLTLQGGLAQGTGVAAQGGAFYSAGRLTLTNSTVSHNVAGQGGGIYNAAGTFTISDSTVADNEASLGGGGIFNAGTLTVTACTIAANSSTSGSDVSLGGGGIVTQGTGSVSLASTIVAGNGDNNSSNPAPDLGGDHYASLGHNLIGALDRAHRLSGIWALSDQVGSLGFPLQAELAPLGDYGGATQTMAPLPSSNALGSGDPSLASTTDQRGISRNQAHGVDVGAYQSRGFIISLLDGDNQSAAVTSVFGTRLAVEVSSPFGEPVAGGWVDFGGPGPGQASANTDGTYIDASGYYSVKAVANNFVGSYQVQAGTAPGFLNPVVFHLTNTTATTAVVPLIRRMAFGSADQTMTLAALVESPAVVSNGTVTFAVLNGSTPLGAALPPCPVFGGYASTTFVLPAGTPPGSYTIVATYTPADPNFIGSSDSTHKLEVVPAATSTSAAFGFAPGGAADQTVPLSAVVTATTGAGRVNGGTVTFKVLRGATQLGAAVTSGPVSNGSASADYVLPGGTAVGPYTIVATYNPSANYTGSSDSTHTLDVGLTAVFANDVFAPVSPTDENVTLSAQVLTPSPAVVVNGGTVTFRVFFGGMQIGTDAISGPVTNGYASATYVLPGGTPTNFYTIVAIYNPSPSFEGAIDGSHQLQVGVTRVNMSLALQAAVFAGADQTVSLTATVTPQSGSGTVNEGTVTFRLLSLDGTTQFGTAVTSGTVTNGSASVTYVLPGGTPVGSYKVLAVYNPSPRYFTSAQISPFQILQSVPTVTTAPIVNVSAAGGTYNGNPFPASATATDVDRTTPVAGSFSFAYYAGSSVSGTPSATAPTSAGTYTVVATFLSSNPNYGNASAQTTFTINPATPTVTVSAAGGTYNGNPYPASATAVGLDGTPVAGSFTLAYSAGIIPGGTPSPTAPTNPGTYTVVATFTSSDPNYRNGTAQTTFTIDPSPPAITGFTIPAAGVEGSPLALSATATDLDPSLGYTWTITRPDGTTFTLTGPSTSFLPTDSGTYSVRLTVTADDGRSATRAASVAVASVAPTITDIAVPATGTEGNPAALSATATDPAGANDPLTYTWTVNRPDGSSFTLTGPSASITPADTGSYNIVLTVSDGDGDTAIQSSRLTVYSQLASAKFVQGVYQRELGRTAAATEVAFWVGVLDGTGGPSAVVSGIVGSTEEHIGRVVSWFETYLGRTPSATETSFWAGLLSGQTEENVLSQIVGSTEFYSRAQAISFGGTPDQNYVQALYQLLLGRAASSAEVTAQVNALAQLGQQGVALSLLQSVEYRANVVHSYYTELLGRTGSQAEVASHVNSSGDLRALRVSFESSVEFFIVSASKAPTITAFTVPATGNVGSPVTLSATATNAAGNFYPLTYTWTVTGPNGTTLTTLTGASATFTPAAVGNYGVRLTVTDEDRFSVSRTATEAVANVAPTVSVSDVGGAYNGNPFSASATAVGLDGTTPVAGSFSFAYYAGSSASGTPSAIAPTNPGTYTVVATFTSSDPNYGNGTAQTTFTINPATTTPTTPTVSVSAAGGTYNGKPFPASGTAVGVDGKTPVAGSFTFAYYAGSSASGTPSATAPSNAGTYTVVATFTSSDANYSNGSAQTTFSISACPLTVTANNASKVYGTANPSFTASYSGFVNGDTPSSLGGTLTFSTQATTSSDVGSYAITPGGLTSANYAITFNNGTLSITPANQTITWNNPADIVYGTPLSATQLDATVSVVGPAAAGALTYTPAAGTVLDAGSNQTLTVNVAATTDYNAATATVSINVKAAPLTITPAGGQSMVLGSTVPVLHYSASGFVNGDGPSLLSGSLGTTATSSSPTGSYPFTLGTLSAGSNYTLALAASPPTFAVTPAATPITVVSMQVNDGSAQRSMVTSLTVTFSQPITTLDPGAFEIDSGTTALFPTDVTVSGNQVVIRFTGLTGVVAGSLADGRYTLIEHQGKIHSGANAALLADHRDAFFRLFGDVNGDGKVDDTDRTAFLAAYRTVRGSSNYRWYLDYDQNGVIDISDYYQFMRRYGTALAP
jgi:hypothetical protein